MYAEDDAVAKLDGYVISVAGAGSLVGKKTLVRIENVGRSAASATLVEGAEITDAAPRGNGSTASTTQTRRKPAPGRTGGSGSGSGSGSGAGTRTAAASSDKPDEAKPRRRGRRGGRGRRKAPSDQGSSE